MQAARAELLTSLLGLNDEDLTRDCSEGQDLGHLQPRGEQEPAHTIRRIYETTLIPDLKYTFRHALTLEIAYQSRRREGCGARHERVRHAPERQWAGRKQEKIELRAHHADDRLGDATDLTRLRCDASFRRHSSRTDRVLNAPAAQSTPSDSRMVRCTPIT
jgi:hypothetical protein